MKGPNLSILFALAIAMAVLLASGCGASPADTTHFHGNWQNANGNDWTRDPTSPANLSFSKGLNGWFKGSDYSTAPDYGISLDPRGYNGRVSAFIRSLNANPQGHAGLSQGLRADHYRGKRVRISAMLRTEGVTGYACLLVHLDTETSYSVIGAPKNNIQGTTPWHRYDIVLDMPGNAQGIFYGVTMQGAGKVSISDVQVDVVGKSLPDTRIAYTQQENSSAGSGFNGTEWANWSDANPAPQNLSFSTGTDGWFQPPASKASATVDPKGGPHGEPCLVLKPTAGGSDAWSSLQQLVGPDRFLGKRIRLSALLNADSISNGADLSMRVASPEGSPYAGAPVLHGTTGWKPCSVVLDMPKDSPGLCIGVTVYGPGTLRVADVRLEVVGKDVPLTPATQR